MKSKLSHLALPTAALCWLLSIAATGCIATAFDLPLTGGMGFLILLLGLFAGLVCLAFDRCKLAVPILLFLCAQLLLMFSFRKNPAQMQTLLPSITEYYQRAYGWPIVLENGPFAQYADLALLQVGLIICFFLCWALMRRRPLLVCLLPLSPLLSCIVVYDTIPSGLYLFLLLLGLTVLWLTHSARRKREVPIGMQSIKLAPIAALCLAVLFLVVPQTDSINPLRNYAEELWPRIENWISQLPAIDEVPGDTGDTGNSVGVSNSSTIDLGTVGPKTQNDAVVLYATSTKSGRTYLRHKMMMYYSGTSWRPSTDISEVFGSEDSLPDMESILIQTTRYLPYLYVPYYPSMPVWFSKGIVPNRIGSTSYSYYLLDTFSPTSVQAPNASRYIDLPDSTRNWASRLVATITKGTTDPKTIAQRIGDYVENSAYYSLNTPQMPASNKDFARWFLEESSTGYCVHFATAATVLLRAAGIPATYIEGVTFQAVANTEVTVTYSNAHAWVEYYDSVSNTWNILDPTPGEGIPGGGTENNPDSPDTPDTPDTPDAPDAPDNPDTPDTPDTPDGPAQPDTPDLPNMTPDDYAKEDWRVWLSQQPWPIKAGLCGAGVVLLILLQAWLRRWYHRRLWSRGSTNQQALQRFRQCRMLAKLLRIELPQQLLDVAQKARYSQHTLHAEELVCYDNFLSACRVSGTGAPLHRRLVRFLIAAL